MFLPALQAGVGGEGIEGCLWGHLEKGRRRLDGMFTAGAVQHMDNLTARIIFGSVHILPRAGHDPRAVIPFFVPLLNPGHTPQPFILFQQRLYSQHPR